MTSKELSVIICVSGLVANYRESEKYLRVLNIERLMILGI